jgi:hypothetical protein
MKEMARCNRGWNDAVRSAFDEFRLLDRDSFVLNFTEGLKRRLQGWSCFGPLKNKFDRLTDFDAILRELMNHDWFVALVDDETENDARSSSGSNDSCGLDIFPPASAGIGRT